jgi:hypothetical protein
MEGRVAQSFAQLCAASPTFLQSSYERQRTITEGPYVFDIVSGSRGGV